MNAKEALALSRHNSGYNNYLTVCLGKIKEACIQGETSIDLYYYDENRTFSSELFDNLVSLGYQVRNNAVGVFVTWVNANEL